MKTDFKKNWLIILLNSISLGSIIYLFECSIYNFILPNKFKVYWVAIPLLFILITGIVHLIFIKKMKIIFLSFNLLSLICFYITISCNKLNCLFIMNYRQISFILLLVPFIIYILLNVFSVENKKESNKNNNIDKLFNIFYLNDSKAYEISMLIDNKVHVGMEDEIYDEFKSSQTAKVNLGNVNKSYADISTHNEEIRKNRILETYDIKQTKSIILRKIYQKANELTDVKKEKGSLVLISDVELKQINLNETMFLLKTLQTMNLNQEVNSDIEVNLNKLIDNMLDDFTIDYEFEKNEKYIIRLPYKNNNFFENGYHHNDLQLGKISIVGIYRGKIDFTEKHSISSKFLEIISKTYANDHEYSVKTSNDYKEIDIEQMLNFEKLKGEYNLIDVISIIQEIKVSEEDK